MSEDGPGVLKATWMSDGRKPTQPPNPAYPDGVDVDMSRAAVACSVALDYPAACCGVWLVECPACGLRVAVTAAGRRDDPRSVRVACGSPEAAD